MQDLESQKYAQPAMFSAETLFSTRKPSGCRTGRNTGHQEGSCAGYRADSRCRTLRGSGIAHAVRSAAATANCRSALSAWSLDQEWEQGRDDGQSEFGKGKGLKKV